MSRSSGLGKTTYVSRALVDIACYALRYSVVNIFRLPRLSGKSSLCILQILIDFNKWTILTMLSWILRNVRTQLRVLLAPKFSVHRTVNIFALLFLLYAVDMVVNSRYGVGIHFSTTSFNNSITRYLYSENNTNFSTSSTTQNNSNLTNHILSHRSLTRVFTHPSVQNSTPAMILSNTSNIPVTGKEEQTKNEEQYDKEHLQVPDAMRKNFTEANNSKYCPEKPPNLGKWHTAVNVYENYRQR